MPLCRICRCEDTANTLIVQEMMFGSDEEFVYQECSECGSLQLDQVPADLSRFYPPGYYSHSQPEGVGDTLKQWAVAMWYGVPLVLPDWVLHLMARMPFLGAYVSTNPFQALRLVRPSRTSSILDVGGGNGKKLRALSLLGFRRLTLVDPWSPAEGYLNGIRYYRGTSGDLGGQFSLIMYHHSLEHVPDIDAELMAAKRLLSPAGYVLVRIPKLPNAVFSQYREAWVQIDAPRHIHIFGDAGLRAAAGRCGLAVVASGDDSTDFQFWGSELYRQHMPLFASPDGGGSFTERPNALARWRLRRHASRLNRRGVGDQGWFLLQHAEPGTESADQSGATDRP